MLIAFNKPYGVISQFTSDGSSNRTLAEFGFMKHVYPIGRLDADSEGLLLLSDEPGLNQRLLHPRHAHEREYWAQVERIPTPEALQELKNGLTIQGRSTLPCHVWVLDPQPEVGCLPMNRAPSPLPSPLVGERASAERVEGWKGEISSQKILSQSDGERAQVSGVPRLLPRDPPIRLRKTVPTCWLGLELIEGKNRQVRRMTAAIGHPTLRLIRVRIGRFSLGNVAVGQWQEVNSAGRDLILFGSQR